MTRTPKIPAPWVPPTYSKFDVLALQALNTGTANESQQKRAIKWIIEQACGTYDFHFMPNSQRDTDFSLGRAFVGQQLVKLIKINPTLIKEPT